MLVVSIIVSKGEDPLKMYLPFAKGPAELYCFFSILTAKPAITETFSSALTLHLAGKTRATGWWLLRSRSELSH